MQVQEVQRLSVIVAYLGASLSAPVAAWTPAEAPFHSPWPCHGRPGRPSPPGPHWAVLSWGLSLARGRGGAEGVGWGRTMT